MPLQELRATGVVLPPPDVQRTTMSIDVAGRYVCNLPDEALTPSVPADTPDGLRNTIVATDVAPPDAIVIGSGMFGSYAASRMYRMGLKVLVLEAGPFLITEHYQNLSISGFDAGANILALEGTSGIGDTQGLVWGQPWRGAQIFRRQAFCIGGKSLFWGGWSPRLTDDVLTGPLDAKGGSWPKSTVDFFNDKDLGYERTELEMGVRERVPGNPGSSEIGTDFFNNPTNRLTKALQPKLDSQKKDFLVVHPNGGTRASSKATIDIVQAAPIAIQAQAPASGLFSFRKFSSLPTLLANIREDSGNAGSVDQRRRLMLVPGMKVLQLETEQTSSGEYRVARIKILGQPDIVVSGKTQVVLALSSIESTRLAIDSFRSISPLNTLMGRNVMAHVRNNVTMRVRRAALGLAPNEQLETSAFHIGGKTESGGRFHIQFYAGFSPNADGDAVLYKLVTDQEVLDELLRNQDPEWVSLTFRGCGEMLGRTDLSPGDDRASYINSSQDVDTQFGGRNRAWVNLVQQPIDIDVFDSIDQVIHRIASGIAGNNPKDVQIWANGNWTDLDDSPFDIGKSAYGKLAQGEGGIRDGLGTTWHEAGSLWMGGSKNNSVTDANGRFHQVENAWCVDQSTFPRIGSANPVPTGITIARLVAESIADLEEGIVRERDASGRTTQFYHNMKEPGFKPLFRFQPGVNLPLGWKHTGGGEFRRFGAILESQGGIGLLYYTNEEFSDCTVRIQWRSLTLRNNSGLYVRLPAEPDLAGGFRPKLSPGEAIKTGYEIQIDNTGDRSDTGLPQAYFVPHHQTGAVYPVHNPNTTSIPQPNGVPSKAIIPSKPLGQWNDMEVRVGGNRIRVVLNGVSVLDNPDDATGDFFDKTNLYQKGLLAFQNHFKGYRVQIRNMRINPGTPSF
jgi:hypothetical protein